MEREQLLQKIDNLVARHRTQCLWFFRTDFLPGDDAMRHKALMYIQRHGTREAALEAAELSRWLLQSSSDASVAS